MESILAHDTLNIICNSNHFQGGEVWTFWSPMQRSILTLDLHLDVLRRWENTLGKFYENNILFFKTWDKIFEVNVKASFLLFKVTEQ